VVIRSNTCIVNDLCFTTGHSGVGLTTLLPGFWPMSRYQYYGLMGSRTRVRREYDCPYILTDINNLQHHLNSSSRCCPAAAGRPYSESLFIFMT
jgi:hypothetical protein